MGENEKASEEEAAEVTQPKTSLYVGDLDAGVTEVDLMATFAGISSARVCRDARTGASLRYAYVNFSSNSLAEKALNEMNHAFLKGKPMRIMWSHRDPHSRKTGLGNLFVKNLDGWIGGAELEALFASFGTVVSCKVALDDEGKSKGFGFVQMDSEEASVSAIGALDGKTLDGGSKKLYVSKFVKRNERQVRPEVQPQMPQFSNLYIKNLDPDITEDILQGKFSEFGKVNSAVIMKDDLGTSRGFGFVSFELPEHAKKALDAMSGSQLGSKTIYVGPAQKKAERGRMLKQQFTNGHDQHLQTLQVVQSSDVFVKNLDGLVNEKKLLEHFSACGKILSSKVMYGANGLHKGFGFIRFSSHEEAKQAVATFNGTMLNKKCLYVAITQSKDERLKSLKQSIVPRYSSCKPRPFLFQPTGLGRFFSNQAQFIKNPGFQFVSHPVLTGSEQSANPQNYYEAPKLFSSPFQQITNVLSGNSYSHEALQLYRSPMQLNGNGQSGYYEAPNSFSSSAGPTFHLSEAWKRAFAEVDPRRQKQMLAILLYPLVQRLEPEHASRITDILLDMSTTELRNILMSPKVLDQKVREATHCLNGRKGKAAATACAVEELAV